MSNPHPNGSLYCDLMEYIKWRVESVSKTVYLVKTKQHYLDNRLAAEFCLLQLRMCCELLAIACVAIHTDIPQTRRFQEEWNANDTFKIFRKIKPNFFPTPCIDQVREDGTIVQLPVEGALTLKEFLQMYNMVFGNLLHSGTFEQYKSSSVQSFDFSLIEDFILKLTKLLNNHTYLLEGNKQMVRVVMNNKKDGRVWLNLLDLQQLPDPHAGHHQ